jgi:hypothetical protein
VHDSVRAGTTFLVAGEKTGQSKLDAARKRGTRVIDEPTLDRLLRGEVTAAELLGPAAPATELAAPTPATAPEAKSAGHDGHDAAVATPVASASKAKKAAKKPPKKEAQPSLFDPPAAEASAGEGDEDAKKEAP